HLLACQRRGAFPANLDSGEKIGLRPGELEQTERSEFPVAEYLGIRNEANRRAAPVRGRTEMLQPASRMSPGELLREQFLVLGDFDPDMLAERIDHADANPVQPAAGCV